MRSLLQQYWFIAIPLGVEFICVAARLLLGKFIYPRLVARRVQDGKGDDPMSWPHVDESGRPQGDLAWVRVLELIFITYHFPIIVPTAYIRKDDTAPLR